MNFDLNKPLIEFSSKEGVSHWTIREAVEGVQIFGGIGSGKTSGSGRMLALKYLQNGFGGLVLTAKADEKEMWLEYCRLTNRLDDLIIVEPGGDHFFNFLQYESQSKIGGTSLTDNLVQVLKTVIQASEDKKGKKENDRFWEAALDMLIFNVIDLCQLAYGEVNIQTMYNIILTSIKEEPKEGDKIRPRSFYHAYNKALEKINLQIETLKDSISEEERKKCQEDPTYMEDLIVDRLPDVHLFQQLEQFFLDHYKSLNEKTKSVIEFSFIGFLFRLLKEPVYSLFCKHESTFTPEDSLDGKIILLNIPVKQYFKVGRDCQILFKYIWQRAMERRDVMMNGRPIFLWADEAQNFLHEYDAEYQATARSSRITTVYISQNLPNYFASMGGEVAQYRVKSFLGTLGTKIFHSNADIDTNKYASELIGQAYTESVQRSNTVSGDFSASRTISFELEQMVRPEHFTGLKNGGTDNALKIECYMHRQGKLFPNGLSHKKVAFLQNYKPIL